MTDWCQNTLTLRGRKADVEDLLGRANRAHLALVPGDRRKRVLVDDVGFTGDQWFSFHAFVPIPDAIFGSTAFGDWAARHWGSKWDVAVAGVSRSPTGISARISFVTAWGPPIPVVEAMRTQYPRMRITARWKDESGDEGRC